VNRLRHLRESLRAEWGSSAQGKSQNAIKPIEALLNILESALADGEEAGSILDIQVVADAYNALRDRLARRCSNAPGKIDERDSITTG
jgi:hypothetical protein